MISRHIGNRNLVKAVIPGFLLVCIAFSSFDCRRDAEQRKPAKDSSSLSKPDLPDSLWPVDSAKRQEFEKTLLDNMRKQCLVVLQKGVSGPNDLVRTVAVGQFEWAANAIQEFRDGGHPPPVPLYGSYGISGDGSPYISVSAISFTRDIIRVIVIYRTPKGPAVEVAYERSLPHKELEFQTQCYFTAEFRSLSDLAAAVGSPSHDAELITFKESSPVPIPLDDDVTACARVEDYSGRMSQFIPIIRFDFTEARHPTSVPASD